MNYFNILQLNQEPFSTSPDPYFFYRSTGHYQILNKIEIAIRLRKGLSLVLADVGLGKTTLSRTLLQGFAQEDDFIFHIILDPSYKNDYEFWTHLAKTFGVSTIFSSP